MKLVAALLSVFIVAPIWYYLLFEILWRVGASELMWFLFWVYVPVALFTSTLVKITEYAN